MTPNKLWAYYISLQLERVSNWPYSQLTICLIFQALFPKCTTEHQSWLINSLYGYKNICTFHRSNLWMSSDNSMPCVNWKVVIANSAMQICFQRSAGSCSIVHTIFVYFYFISCTCITLFSGNQLTCCVEHCHVLWRGEEVECHEAREPTLTLLQYMPGSTLPYCNSVLAICVDE